MARPLRIEYPGAYYHVMNRGQSRRNIFIEDKGRQIFLDLLADIARLWKVEIFAYCLMDNHYHLLIETPGGICLREPGSSMGSRSSSPTGARDRVGHVLQGRYKAILVEKDSYLLELCRYVVLNPVRVGMVRSAREYRWSSYRATAGLSATPELLVRRRGGMVV